MVRSDVFEVLRCLEIWHVILGALDDDLSERCGRLLLTAVSGTKSRG